MTELKIIELLHSRLLVVIALIQKPLKLDRGQKIRIYTDKANLSVSTGHKGLRLEFHLK